MINDSKICPSCKIIKTHSAFNQCKGRRDGLACYCKPCAKEISHKYYTENREKFIAQASNWQKENVTKSHEINKRWYTKNCEKRNETINKWQAANPEKIKEYNRQASRRRRKTIKGVLVNRTSSYIWRLIRNGKKEMPIEKILGYSIDELKNHLEKQFKEGMNWERFMKGAIHIDHIIPISAFNYEKPEDEDFKRCWSLKNLQPLWAKDNLSKSNRINKHFQPTLFLTKA